MVLLTAMLVNVACSQQTMVPAPSTTTTTSTPDTGTTATTGSALSLDASGWSEGLVPTFVTFRNDASGAVYIDVPGAGQAVSYAFAPAPTSSIAGSLHLAFRIETLSGQPVFVRAPEVGNTCATPPSVRPFIFANRNDWSGEFSRWWATREFVVLAPGTFTLDVPLTPERWTSVYGRTGVDAPGEFSRTLSTVSSLGVSFGGGCFYGHGVFAAGGTARWTLTSYLVR